MGGREKSQDKSFFFGNIGDAVKQIGDVDVIGRRDDDADIGRAVGGQSLSKSARLIA